MGTQGSRLWGAAEALRQLGEAKMRNHPLVKSQCDQSVKRVDAELQISDSMFLRHFSTFCKAISSDKKGVTTHEAARP